MQSYWDVPIVYGINEKPTSDQLKHFGAALASFGSTPLFHLKDITPEANQNLINNTKGYYKKYTNDDINQFYLSYQTNNQKLDVVVFAAPQLSLDEMQRLSFLLDGQKIHHKITPSEYKTDLEIIKNSFAKRIPGQTTETSTDGTTT